MSMSRKDFKLVADTIRAMPPQVTREQVAERFAGTLNGANANFNPELFKRACDPKAAKQS